MEYLRDRNDGRGMKDSFLVGEHACAVILFADLRDAEDAEIVQMFQMAGQVFRQLIVIILHGKALLRPDLLVGIFLSEALTNLTMKYLGRGAIYLSGALSLGAVLLFGYFQNLTMLALTLFLLGASKSFGAAGREILFCRQPVVAQYGEDEAMGYYNLADNLGESIGTMVFGGMLSIGLVTGMWIFMGISAVTLGIYTLMGKQKK